MPRLVGACRHDTVGVVLDMTAGVIKFLAVFEMVGNGLERQAVLLEGGEPLVP